MFEFMKAFFDVIFPGPSYKPFYHNGVRYTWDLRPKDKEEIPTPLTKEQELAIINQRAKDAIYHLDFVVDHRARMAARGKNVKN